MTAPPKPILASLNPAQRQHAEGMLDRLVDRSGGPDACWPWTGGSFKNGYGSFWTLGTAKTRRLISVHRLAYELANDGDCPPVVDHMCHDNAECDLAELCPHRRCANFRHLASSSNGQNVRRAQYGRYAEVCRAGHRMSGENLYEAPDGSRRCKRCAADRAREKRARRSDRVRVPLRSPRPRNVPLAEVVDWALDGQGPESCMFWPGSKPHSSGYVYVGAGREMVAAHRLVYEIKNRPIPEGMIIDHACHDPETCEGGLDDPHRACINPLHLALSTNAQNVSPERAAHRRPDECKHGHSFTDENTYFTSAGTRQCVACRRDSNRKARSAAKEASGGDNRFRDGSMCRNGHDVSVTGLTPIGKCAECTREAARRTKLKAREARGSAPAPKRMVAPGTMCANGHDKSVVGVLANYGCRECANERRRAARAATSAEREAQRGTMCRRGLHDKAVTGVTSNGSCAECKREAERQRGSGIFQAPADQRRRRQGNMCRNGHDVTVQGLASDGSCAECKRESTRRHAAKKAAHIGLAFSSAALAPASPRYCLPGTLRR